MFNIQYTTITNNKFYKLMNIYDKDKKFTINQLSCFLIKDKCSYIAIDNRSGDMWTEEFNNLKSCINYFNEEDIKNY